MKISIFAAVTLSLFWNSASCAEQSYHQPTAPTATTLGQAEAASIYVTAETNKGMLIRDLKPESLNITEDKVPVKIEKITCGKPEPLLVGILVDVSGSRRTDSHLLAHDDALEAFLHTLLSRDDWMYIVAYDDKVYKLSELVADPAGVSAAFDRLRKHEPHSSTALYDAIKAAAGANFKGRLGHRTMVVVGDWEDNSSHVSSDEAMKAAQRTATTVYALVDSDNGILSKKAHKRAVDVARDVTENTGGAAYVAEEKDDFAKALQVIGAAVTGSCRVEYTATGNADTKKGAKLRVEATSKGMSILYPHVRFSPAQ